MNNRSASYDEAIATRLVSNPKLAREMLLHAIECGDSVQQALVYTITKMGAASFAKKANTNEHEVCRFLENGSKDAELLNKYLSVFGCELTARVAKKRKAA